MKDTKHRLHKLYLLLPLLLLTLLHPQSTLLADPSAIASDDDRKVLQNSLSIVEIDHEIERITEQQNQAQKELDKQKIQLDDKLLQIKDKQNNAGAIIRSYYMGDKDNLLIAMLSAKSLSSMLDMYGYYEMIMDYDRSILDTYETQYRVIKDTKSVLERTASALENMKANLLKQRERVLALQKEVDTSIAGSDNPEALKKMIEEFTIYWESVGINEVKRYFEALSSAMDDLPEFIQNQEGAIRTNGATYSIDINEEDLNAFLRTKNELFNQFSFHFGDDQITASGQDGSLSLEVVGHYSVEEKPQNAIMFHVDKLIFNGYELPDTTCRTLEDEFDLGFYPQQVISFVKATEVKSTDKNLHVTLKLSL